MIHNIFNLTGKNALITGGSKGIGRAIAFGLAGAGASPLIVCRNEGEGRKTLDEICSKFQVSGDVFTADLASRKSTDTLVNSLIKSIGIIDILVHSAGTNKPQAVVDIENNSWDNILELNLNSAMALVRGLSPAMRKNKWGRIILISSIMGIASREERGAYSASKAGLMGFMKSAALELGKYGITVNCIAPGPIETDLTAELVSSEVGKDYASRMALHRWGKVDELIGPAILLASEAGSFITGTSLVVDGGSLCRAI